MFVTNVDGWAALALWCLDGRYLRGLHTAAELIGVFAPPSENNTRNYAMSVAANVGPGELDLRDTAVLTTLCKSIAHYEDARLLWSETEMHAGMTLAALRWPQYRLDRGVPAQPGYPAAKPAEPVIETADDLNQDELGKLGEKPA